MLRDPVQLGGQDCNLGQSQLAGINLYSWGLLGPWELAHLSASEGMGVKRNIRAQSRGIDMTKGRTHSFAQ